jgi:hypothetical protein
MRNSIPILLLVGILYFLPLKSRATHIYGGEISYQALGPGIFAATYTSYYALNFAITPSLTIDLNLRAPGCNAGRTITATRQSNTVQYINGGTSNKCNANPPDRVGVFTYTATFVLQNTQCPEWYLSVSECPKRNVDNIPASQSACLYLEATINPQTISLQRSSPVFLPPASLIFNVNAPATFSNQAIQNNSQSDSITYTLKPALMDHNLPLTYAANMSFSQPLPASSGVFLHPKTGMMTFTPNVYQSNTYGANLYTVVVEATAYRKINGVMRKVSAAQRSLPVFIVNNPTNANPTFLNVTANAQPVQANGVTEVLGGNAVTMQFGTTDANPGDSLRLVFPGPQFAGSPINITTSTTGGARPSGTLTIHSTAAATDKLYYFPLAVMDNACPVRGVTTQIYGIKVLANPLGLKKELASAANFTAYPNPFTEGINFKFDLKAKAESIEIYNLLGQQIDRIAVEKSEAGEQKISWEKAQQFKAGTYVARLIAKDKTVKTLKFTKL